MVVAHNIVANFTNRQLNITNKSLAKSSERLASGYRINRAADDSAGLAISEQMRGQIRGLNRGAQNCVEGIDMVDTAEAAIGEQIDVLQRIRELTIEAYNDTYVYEDRIAIQKEVDALSAELQRITDQTEFNTIKVLQGPKEVWSTETIYPSTEYTEYCYKVPTERDFPTWATHDTQMQSPNPSVVVDPGNVDTSVYTTYNLGNPDQANYPEVSYGPTPDDPDDKIANHNWQGEWSNNVQDKYSARIDFSAIAGLTTREDLYQYMADLAGTAIGYRCATCARMQVIGFSTNDVRLVDIYRMRQEVGGSGYSTSPSEECETVDLQKYCDIVNNLLAEEEYDALPPDQKASLGADYSTYINQAAKSIASGIVDEIAQKGAKYDDHFIRIVKDDANPYQIDFYDFRDAATIKDTSGGLSFIQATAYIESRVLVKNYPVELARSDIYDYYIQAGANSWQGVEVDLPNTSLEALDFLDYNIFREGGCSATKDGKWDPELLDSAKYLGNHRYSARVGGYEQTREVTSHYTEYITNVVTVPPYIDAHGERVAGYSRVEILGSYTKTYTGTITEIVGGKDIEFTAYKPDSLLRVDHAIESLTDDRAYLGAVHNRLEHAYANDQNSSENLQSAESKLRDTDMADEMVRYAALNIVSQAGFSMLAQANSSKDGILQLLRA